MFKIACGLREHGGWEIRPSEFWKMTPGDWWSIYNFNVGDSVREDRETKDRLKRLYREAQ